MKWQSSLLASFRIPLFLINMIVELALSSCEISCFDIFSSSKLYGLKYKDTIVHLNEDSGDLSLFLAHINDRVAKFRFRCEPSKFIMLSEERICPNMNHALGVKKLGEVIIFCHLTTGISHGGFTSDNAYPPILKARIRFSNMRHLRCCRGIRLSIKMSGKHSSSKVFSKHCCYRRIAC